MRDTVIFALKILQFQGCEQGLRTWLLTPVLSVFILLYSDLLLHVSEGILLRASPVRPSQEGTLKKKNLIVQRCLGEFSKQNYFDYLILENREVKSLSVHLGPGPRWVAWWIDLDKQDSGSQKSVFIHH